MATITFTCTGLAHSPPFGVKVSIAVPAPAALGLNSLQQSIPIPDHDPGIPDCTVGKLTIGSVSQYGPIGSGTITVLGITINSTSAAAETQNPLFTIAYTVVLLLE
jgi:hypothetical protein